MLTQIEELIQSLDEIADARSRATAHDLIAAIVALNGAGLQKIVEIIKRHGYDGDAPLHKIAGDDLTGGLLALHGLHPDSIETRVKETLRRFGVEAQITISSGGHVAVPLQTSGYGLKRRLEAALRAACPDAAAIEVEELRQTPFFVPLASLTTK